MKFAAFIIFYCFKGLCRVAFIRNVVIVVESCYFGMRAQYVLELTAFGNYTMERNGGIGKETCIFGLTIHVRPPGADIFDFSRKKIRLDLTLQQID